VKDKQRGTVPWLRVAAHGASSRPSERVRSVKEGSVAPVLAAAAIRALAAIADRIFPADEETPGGADLGVVDYVLAQLAGAWGSGERTYRAGPFARPPH